MSRPLRQTEHHTSPSGGDRIITTGPPSTQEQEPTRTTQQQPIVLPSVASLTAYGELGPDLHGGGPTRLPPPRAFGVPSILNPAVESEYSRSSARIESPARNTSTSYALYSTPLHSPRLRKRKDVSSPVRPQHGGADARSGRRLLTPRSPALRSISQGAYESHSGLQTRIFTAEPGETTGGIVPPIPPIPRGIAVQDHATNFAGGEPGLQTYQSHSYPPASYPPAAQAHIASPAGSSSIGLADREAASPYHSSVSEPTSLNRGQTGHGNQALARSSARTYGAGQPPYQMELSTESGPMILPVEVDLQQASKLADEKRKRNAGASARFRQRRKEKEIQASSHISELQRQVREITEDRDFYLNERNIFRDMLARTPGAAVPPRPPSPRLRRTHVQAQFAPNQLPPSPTMDYAAPSPAQRRRTSSYRPSFAPAPAPLAPSNYTSPFPGLQAPTYAPPQSSLPPNVSDTRGQPIGPPPGQLPHPSFQPATAQPHPAPPPRLPNVHSAPYERSPQQNQRHN